GSTRRPLGKSGVDFLELLREVDAPAPAGRGEQEIADADESGSRRPLRIPRAVVRVTLPADDGPGLAFDADPPVEQVHGVAHNRAWNTEWSPGPAFVGVGDF